MIGKGGAILTALAKAFIESDASLAEINPLVLTAEGQVQAADAKILIDDNGLFRQKEYASWAESEESNPLEYEAKQAGLTYVKLDGNVGIIGNGAGLVMTTLDMVARVGGKPANFLDIGGGAKAEVMYKALTFVARDPQVKGILVNIFGGITRGEEVAKRRHYGAGRACLQACRSWYASPAQALKRDAQSLKMLDLTGVKICGRALKRSSPPLQY